MQLCNTIEKRQPRTTRERGAPFFQPKFNVSEFGDMYERETGAAAKKIVDTDGVQDDSSLSKSSRPLIQRKCQHCEEEEKRVQRKKDNSDAANSGIANGGPIQSFEGKGVQLTQEERHFFEPRFGVDFSNVRLHAGSDANQSAKSIDALAYTQGNNIVFGLNQYNTGSNQGKRLLAHELTHVVQQGSGNVTSTIQRKTPPPSQPLFLQHAKDNLADLKQRRGVKLMGGSTYYPEEVRTAEKYLAFAAAVAGKNTADIPALFKNFMAADVNALFPDYPVIEDLSAIIANLMELGLDKEAAQLQSFTPGYIAGQERSTDPFAYKIYLWGFILDNLPKALDIKDANAVQAAIDVWVKYMGQLVTQAINIEPQIKGKMRPERSGRHGDETAFDFLDALQQDFSGAFVQFGMLYQRLLDKAIDDLQNNKGNASLELAKAKLDALKALKPPDGLLDAETDITKTIIEAHGGIFSTGKHIDFFMQGKDALVHSEDIELYDPKADSKPPEKVMSVRRMFEIRDKQINALEQLYGFQKDKSGNITAEAQENAAAIKDAGGLKLHNDDDWRRFLLKKFALHKAANNNDKVKAFDAIIATIKLYMNAFTIHTPYNIIESKGVNQLQIKFPRALTGQLIHDCGVYALRITYMLSLIRNDPDLKLSIQFVKLPFHTGLIITGEGLPTYIAHNDMIATMDAADIAKRRQAWDTETKKIGGNTKDNTQFLGELAAEEFIPGAKMPFRLETAPPSKDSKKYAAELWKFYMKSIVPDVFSPSVLKPGDKNYRMHLMYLDVLEMYKNFYNTFYRKFWNGTVVPQWKAHKSELQAAGADRFNALFEVYKKPVLAAFDEANNNFSMIRDKLQEIKETVEANPDMVADKIRITNSGRMVKVAGDWMEIQGDVATDQNVHQANDKRDITIDPLD
ncbi:MAG TPA: DUF4157 domain-containing protein [Chitinophagaceae bacterium]|nr:DUF4157 domain-containing protein [Chitinophagaceae bacterium]